MDDSTRETDINDLSLGVIHALRIVDASALSYVQLRRLYAALVKATNDVDDEIAKRSEASNPLGETVRIKSPKRERPADDE